jgi:uncharacterized membrane protein YhdT
LLIGNAKALLAMIKNTVTAYIARETKFFITLPLHFVKIACKIFMYQKIILTIHGIVTFFWIFDS